MHEKLRAAKRGFQGRGYWVKAEFGMRSAELGPKIVNIFLKYFCAQELWSRVGVFACLRVLARGDFGAVVGREKKCL